MPVFGMGRHQGCRQVDADQNANELSFPRALVLELMDLDGAADVLVKTYSGGMIRALPSSAAFRLSSLVLLKRGTALWESARS